MSKHKAESNDLPRSKSFWVGGCAAWFAWIASIVLAGPKLGFWSSLPGCGPQSGCDLVTNGPLGNISLGGFLWPVSFVGIAWFVSIAALWMNTRGTSKSLLWFVRLGVLGSLGFVIAMIVSGHFCKWCALVHFFNLVLWICAELRIRSTKNVCNSGDAKSFVFLLVSTSLFIGVLYLFTSSKKSADDKKAGEENVSEIINTAADSSTLALLESKHRLGSPDAPIQVVVFTDYQCPDCKRYETQLARIYKQRNDLSIVVKHFPFNFDCNDEIGSMKLHANACWAARAAETAYILGGDSGWERMHTWLFENSGSFTDATFDGDLIALGFNPKEFTATMTSQITLNNVKSDAGDGKALGVLFTPMIFINGVEISVTWRKRTLHIVGLNFDESNINLINGLKQIRKGREKRAEKMAHSLGMAGIFNVLEGANKFSKHSTIGRIHFAQFLVSQGHAKDIKHVFKKFLTPGKPGYVDHEWASLEDAVSWITDAGGDAVIAHPGRYDLGKKLYPSLLADFKAFGGSGIEVMSGSQDPSQSQYFAELAKEYDLFASCGSDFHGPGISHRAIGFVKDLPDQCKPIWLKWPNIVKDIH